MATTYDRFDHAEFRQHVHTGEHGELLFDAPVEIKTKEDLDFFGISWQDTKTLRFGRSEQIHVFYYRTENRAYADDAWRHLSTKHSSEYAATRCMVPGIRKSYIRCSDRHSCADCPYGRTPEAKQAPIISLNLMVEEGCEPTSGTDESRVLNGLVYSDIRKQMDAEDPRISRAFELKVLCGYSVREIATALCVSEPRVYQLIHRAKQIGREYRRETYNEHF